MLATIVLAAAMVIHLLCCAVLIFRGGRALRVSLVEGGSQMSEALPAVGVVVPIAGADENLAAVLESLVAQDYPSYELIFVTRDRGNPATRIIQHTIEECSFARQAIGGKAVQCGQKNHNLLAGVKAVSEHAQVLVFCDSTRLVPPGWLSAMIKPIAAGEGSVTSGYHHVVPADRRIAALGHAVTVLFLYLTKWFAWLNQPWGGGTAIKRVTFEALEVEKLWSTNVVDDVSLAARLKHTRIVVEQAPGACVFTPLARETLAAWAQWFIRQILYLKYCLPAGWVAAAALCSLQAALLLLATGICMAGVLSAVPLSALLCSAVYVVSLGALAFPLRQLHPHPGPWHRWLAAYFGAMLMACWCSLKSIFGRRISWRGISYGVAWGGRVIDIRED